MAESEQTPAEPTPRDPASAQRRRFDTVLRGYERTQVDEHVARLIEQNAALHRELTESERRRQAAEEHASATESEIRTVRSQQQQYGPTTPPEESFGFRAEKLLRLAEQEAVDVRTKATREATTLVEQARAEAEKHRHEVEQALIARSASLDEQAAQRTTELQERERQIAEQLAAARSEAETLHQAARRTADQHREQAESAAEAVRVRAAHDAQRVRDQAQQEVGRLTALQNDIRAELSRLAEQLAAEVNKPAAAAPEPETAENDDRREQERDTPADEGRVRRLPARTASR